MRRPTIQDRSQQFACGHMIATIMLYPAKQEQPQIVDAVCAIYDVFCNSLAPSVAVKRSGFRHLQMAVARARGQSCSDTDNTSALSVAELSHDCRDLVGLAQYATGMSPWLQLFQDTFLHAKLNVCVHFYSRKSPLHYIPIQLTKAQHRFRRSRNRTPVERGGGGKDARGSQLIGRV